MKTAEKQEIEESVKQADTERRMKKAQAVRAKYNAKAEKMIAEGEYKARKIEMNAHKKKEKKVRLDVHGRAKPAMRGWLHLITAPLSLASGIVLICLSPAAGLKCACAVFMTCSLFLFANSACYHLGNWSPKVTDVLRRIDHANIFLLIAGTYTPVSFALSDKARQIMLASMWICTTIAITMHVVWINCPRWLSTITYIIFGISGVFCIGLFFKSPAAGPVATILILTGGACYISGAVIYGLRKPNPWPRIFGFHEIFHVFTVLGYACHCVAVYWVICHV
ncbi:MAG: hemolysin III family protein [Bifidobacteriaceae bacterium]|nr:hemolysin III family protein [Bifidobacteriaceae bacterium]MEE0941283.1 hemolysin III family protein [Bifidobacteriaceae bacterium]